MTRPRLTIQLKLLVVLAALAVGFVISTANIGAALIAAALSLIALVLVRKTILAPIAEARRQLHLIGQGRYDETLDTTRNDEIGDLLRDLDSMRSRLAEAVTRRDAAEETLRRSEERFALALQGANDGLWDWNLATGALYLSPRWKQILGYQEHEIENSFATFERLLHPEDAAFAFASIDQYVSGLTDTLEAEIRLRHKNGHYINGLTKAAAARDEWGRPLRIVGTLHDASEQRRAERRLALQYSATRALSEATTLRDSVARWLKAIGESCGWAAGCAWALKGDSLHSIAVWSGAELESSDWKGRMAGLTMRLADATMAATTCASGQPRWDVTLDGGDPTVTDSFASGLTVPVLYEGRVVGAVQLFSKDTQQRDDEYLRILYSINSQIEQALSRRRMEKELATAERKYREIVEQSVQGIYQSTRDGRFLSANAAFARMMGYERAADLLEAPAGTADGMYVDPEHRVKFFNEIGAAGVVTGFESQMRRRDGSVMWTSENARVVHDSAGQPLYCEGFIEDITARVEANQMKADFISFVTHQLRTPLAGIKWMLELAAQEHTGEQTTEFIMDARASAERLINLVNDLLDVSRLEAGRLLSEPQPTDLAGLARAVVAELTPLAVEKNQSLTNLAVDDLPQVMVDPQLARQAVLNLVSNAIKYTPAGGQVTVRLASGPGSVELVVSDTGIGIPASAQRRLFEKFYRADNALAVDTEGTGLGLYLVRLIVERSGGRISCDSREGAGSTFRFTLPHASSASRAA